MARELLASARGASAAVSGIMPPWLMAIFMIAASVCIVSLTVFLCGRSSHTGNDDGSIPKKKPAAAKAAKAAKASRPASSGSTAVSYEAAYVTGALASTSSGGCGGGGCGGGGCGGGGCGGC